MTDEIRFAQVEPISDDINWSARAALGDSLSRCPQDADLMVVWMTKDGKMHWSKSCSRAVAVYMMNAAIHKLTFDFEGG